MKKARKVKEWLRQTFMALHLKMVLLGAIALRRYRISCFIHPPLFFSLDGKETKDQAPSMLPPH